MMGMPAVMYSQCFAGIPAALKGLRPALRLMLARGSVEAAMLVSYGPSYVVTRYVLLSLLCALSALSMRHGSVHL
jgi:hypothetical protein